MSLLEHYYTDGVACDARGCEDVFRWPMVSGWSAAWDCLRDAQTVGWRMFVGRSRRHYCPDHGPAPGHKMREVVL